MQQKTPSDKAMLDTFAECERYIDEQLRRIRAIDSQHRHSDDDLRQEAWIGFLHAYRTYKPGLGQGFARRVSFLVWYRLLRLVEQSNRKHGRAFASSQNGDLQSALDAIELPQTMYVSELLDELTDDARTLVMLAFDTPNDLAELMQNSKAVSALSCMKNYLQGWSVKRFRDAVADVRESLWLGAT